MRITNGKVVENESYFDVYTMLEQLDVLPPAAKLAVRRSDTQPGAMASTS